MIAYLVEVVVVEEVVAVVHMREAEASKFVVEALVD